MNQRRPAKKTASKPVAVPSLAEDATGLGGMEFHAVDVAGQMQLVHRRLQQVEMEAYDRTLALQEIRLTTDPDNEVVAGEIAEHEGSLERLGIRQEFLLGEVERLQAQLPPAPPAES